MNAILTGMALVVVGYFMGFIMGVWATRDWIEQIAPGTSRYLIDLEERQQRNQK